MDDVAGLLVIFFRMSTFATFADFEDFFLTALFWGTLEGVGFRVGALFLAGCWCTICRDGGGIG